jgi:NTP pyrophosphatase (non-canonical NTP hydrolase)
MDVQYWQDEIRDFVHRVWGEKAMMSLPERAARIVEEAVELAQAHDVPQEIINKIIERVYARPPGNPGEEAGDIQFTLFAYTETAHVDIESVLAMRLERAAAIPVEDLRERHKQKRAAGTLLYED